MTPSRFHTLWEVPHAEPIAARVAIGGDFLPAGDLEFPFGADWPTMAQPVASHFDDIDATCLNLESVLDTEGLPARTLNGLGEIVSAPPASLEYLRAIRTHAVGIANNHSYDFGSAGVTRTRSAILQREMIPLGAGRTLEDLPEFSIWKGLGETRVGFWAAAKATHDPAAAKYTGVEPATISRARQALRVMKDQGARFCIALLHAGCLRTNRPAPEEVALLDSLAQSGFDVVAASHSHRISGSRQIGSSHGCPRFCFYGLGSLVSGYIASPQEREGLIVVAGLSLNGSLVQLEVRPIHIAKNGFGEAPSPQISESILNHFRSLSAEIGDASYEDLFYEDMSRGLLRLYARDVRAAFRQSGIRGLARKASHLRVRHVRRLLHKVVG